MVLYYIPSAARKKAFSGENGLNLRGAQKKRAAALWMKRLRRYPFRLRKKTTLCAHFFVRSAARFFTQKSAGAY
ncbi:MAG: hypothetical protein DBY36_06960 [Clostridiales bacterium]|nr:MAG: hypothetical protein DBY36_06960 [Clostridiales bacterium]